MLCADGSVVLHPPDVEGEEEALVDCHHHLDELALGELKARDRRSELVAFAGVVESGLVARAGSADRAEEDAEARLIEARQGALHSRDSRQHGIGRQADIVEHELRGHRGAE